MRVYRLAWLLLLALLVACGPSQAEYDKLAQEKTALAQQVNKLESEADELKNGAPRRLGEIEAAFRAGNFDQVASETNQLAQRHPGAPETTKAIKLAAQAEDRISEIARRKETEAEAIRREAERSERAKVRDVIRISRLWTSNPNSAGGVDLHIVLQNRSSKTIKYASFAVEAYNAVGDPVTCSIRGYSEVTAHVTGPIRPGGWFGENRLWEAAWYNNSIARGKLNKIQIEYTDGSTAEFSGNQARYALK